MRGISTIVSSYRKIGEHNTLSRAENTPNLSPHESTPSKRRDSPFRRRRIPFARDRLLQVPSRAAVARRAAFPGERRRRDRLERSGHDRSPPRERRALRSRLRQLSDRFQVASVR
jgi:hypothetical protein